MPKGEHLKLSWQERAAKLPDDHEWFTSSAPSHGSDALRCFAMGYGEEEKPDVTRYYQLPPGLLGGSVGWQAG